MNVLNINDIIIQQISKRGFKMDQTNKVILKTTACLVSGAVISTIGVGISSMFVGILGACICCAGTLLLTNEFLKSA